jgi:hypothetical protein
MKTLLLDVDNITIGSDPEFFIVDRTGNAFPSTDIFSGTKDSPVSKGDGYAVLKDNVLVEGNIPPAKNEEEFVSFMKNLKEMINEVLEPVGLILHAEDSMEYKPRYLRSDEANLFGCSSYRNAWEIGSFQADNMSRFNKRVAGFHIHIGYTLLNDSISKKEMDKFIARAFDYFVVFPARQHHNDPFREKYYGGYGNYRNTPYGNECRALGGFFTDDEYLPWVYRQTIKAVTFCSDPENVEKLMSVDVLSTGDLELANKFYGVLGISLPDQLIKK